jgi:hypothetical protein
MKLPKMPIVSKSEKEYVMQLHAKFTDQVHAMAERAYFALARRVAQ